MDKITKIESRGNRHAVSSCGARGIRQMMPYTWARVTRELYGHSLPFRYSSVNRIAIRVSNYYMNVIIPRELRRYHVPVTTETKVAAYDCGPYGVKKAMRHKGNWERHLPSETRGYLKKYHRA